MPDVWGEVEIVELPPPIVPRADCPECGAGGRIIVMTLPNGADGSITRRCKCRECSARFVEIVLPANECELDDYERFTKPW